MPKYPVNNRNKIAKNPCEFCLNADIDLVIDGEDGCEGGCERKRAYDYEIKKQSEETDRIFEAKAFDYDSGRKEIEMPMKKRKTEE